MTQYASPTRTAAFALMAVAATAATNVAHAQDPASFAAPEDGKVMQLSAAECMVFSKFALRVMKSIGRENLSDEFVSSVKEFAVKKKCTGPHDFPADGQDIDAWVAISGILGSNGIMLDGIGVRAVKPAGKPLAALTAQPAPAN